MDEFPPKSDEDKSITISKPDINKLFKSAPELNEFTAFVASRGMTPEEALDYGILPLPNRGVQINYSGLEESTLTAVDGKNFWRERYYIPRDGKRYNQRAGSGTAAYLPQVKTLDWVLISNEAKEPLWFTEGEFKALEVGRKWNVPCIGLGGVTGWYPSKKEPNTANLCRPLDKFIWLGRIVHLVFDYDGYPGGEYKPTVDSALNSFALKLFTLGADVRFLHLGRTSLARVNSKCGLDDYIQAGGTIEELFSTEKPYVGDENLILLTKRFAFYAPTPAATIIDLEDGSLQTLASWQSRQRHMFTAAVDKGKVSSKRSTELWLDSPKRITVRGYCFRPSEPTGLTKDDHYNLWTGFRVGPKASEEKLGIWLKFGERLFGPHWEWMQQWCAHIFQRPEQKCTITVTVMSSQEGIGKTLFGDFLANIIGTEQGHARYIGVNQMFEKHTEWPKGTLLAVVNELQSGYDRHEDQLKDLVTADRCWINPKGLREYSVEALFRLYFTTNRDYPFRMTAESRRHFVYQPELLASDNEWKGWLKTVVGPLSTDEEALGAIHSYLLDLDLSTFNPKDDAPWTEAREHAAEASLSNNEAIGDGLWQELPDVFVLGAELRNDPKYRHALRYVANKAASKAPWQYWNGKTNATYQVYSKYGMLGKKSMSDGKFRIDTVIHDIEELKKALEATKKLVMTKYSL